jgi:SEC-C motif
MEAKKQGRNERCSCGSGKKYKYCHGSINYRAGVTPEPNHQTTETEIILRDAETQLRVAFRHAADPEILRSCVNGFIESARSVTFVMRREFGGRGELLRDWFEAQSRA